MWSMLHTVVVLAQDGEAQNTAAVQWATEVVGFSSQDNKDPKSKQFKASQVLGKPNKLPAGGLSPCAWSPASENSPSGEWIKVAFDKPMPIRQVAIAENFNPGAVSQVFLYDENDTEYPAIYQNMNVENLSSGARMFSVYVPLTSYNVKGVKVVLNTQKVAGLNQIDAIAISDSEVPVKAEITLAPKIDLNLASKPENLGAKINTPYQEVSPIISPDGKRIYFTRAKHPQNLGAEKKQDVWFADLNEDGSFQEAINIGPPINTEHNNSSFSITPDGNKMLLNNVYLADGSLTKGLSITTKGADGNWILPKEVLIEDYYNKNKYSEFCLSANSQVLLMTTQRDDSFGDKDIYVSFMQANGVWSQPINLGSVVNTPAAETSPFLASDETTLYFSTSGLSGYGSNDVFVTRRLDDTWLNWSEPLNLGPEINTQAWDAYFSITAAGDYAYYTSYHNSIGDADIFRVKLSEVNRPDPVALIKGTVFNAATGEPMEAEIDYEILPEGENAGKANANPQNGEYQIVLPLKKNYGLRAEAKGFFPIEENIDLSQENSYQEIKKDLYLAPIVKGQTVRLNNIFFVRGKARLLPESFPELNRLASMMNENPTVLIQLEGHTEPLGSKKELVELSKARVIAVRDFLIEQGVSEARIKYKAFGGSKPLSLETTEEARAINRRVEVRILK